MPYANPIVLYTFDSNGTNSGIGGATYNITNGTTTISSSVSLKGSGSLSVPLDTPMGASVPIMTYNTGQNGITISLWIKSSSDIPATGNRFIYSSKGVSQAANVAYNDGLFMSGTNSLNYYSKGYNTNNVISGVNLYGDNNWHHMVVVYNGGIDSAAKIYLDNTLITSTGRIRIGDNNDQQIWIGGCYYGENHNYGAYGNIDDFRIYNYVADATFVSYLYKLGSNTSVATLSSVAVADLLAAGASQSQLIDAGKSVTDLINAGYTASQLFASGIPLSQLINYVQWLDLSATSNIFNQTYVNNFVDLSGDLIVRNDGAVIVGGDASFNNINVASSAKFANDMTLKSRLFIGNDISVNGNLYVGGDLSVNGQFSGNFANNVIPTSAIINYPNSGTNLAITGNVRVTGDASFNGTTVDLSTNTILRVTGQIAFNDGTIMSTYDDNILSGSFALGNAVFKNSTFAAVTCTGSVSATTKTTSSDYRIKTNVTDLDESYTVDSLVPIQYDNRLSNIHELGLIAHELQAVYPELVKGDKDGAEYQCVNYNGLIGVLVKEVQELKRRKENLCKK